MKTQHLTPIIIIVVLFVAVLAFVSLKSGESENRMKPYRAENISAEGVCPPFHLLTEEGNTIDPVRGLNSDKPYSTKQTCGRCHDYELITQGYHFQQGYQVPVIMVDHGAPLLHCTGTLRQRRTARKPWLT